MKTKAANRSHEHKRFYLRHAVPALVWLGSLGGVIWMFQQRAQRFEIVGIARGEVRQVATSSTGRIKDIPVQLYQPVTVGQTLAVVDTILDNEQTLKVEIQSRLETAGAKIEHLAEQLIAMRETMEAEDGAGGEPSPVLRGRGDRAATDPGPAGEGCVGPGCAGRLGLGSQDP
jgi:multidrug resistance efflux pump